MNAQQVEDLMLPGDEVMFSVYGTWTNDSYPGSNQPHKAGEKYSSKRNFDSWWDWCEVDGCDYVDVPGLGHVCPAEYDTGGEGHGENIYMVFRVEYPETTNGWGVSLCQYFRVDGYYSSYGGSEWDGDMYEVKPVERMVTFYEKVSD